MFLTAFVFILDSIKHVVNYKEIMKKGFSLINDLPKIKLKMTRDSVCASDDIYAPHEINITHPLFTDPVELISHISSGYLPSVAGIGHSWDCIFNGKVIGNVSVKNITSTLREIQYAEKNVVHFKYNSATF